MSQQFTFHNCFVALSNYLVTDIIHLIALYAESIVYAIGVVDLGKGWYGEVALRTPIVAPSFMILRF